METLKLELEQNIEKYLLFDISAQQAENLEFFHFPPSYKGACEWLEQRAEELHKEFEENLEKHGFYGSSYDVCRSYSDEEVSLYETTSGTILVVTPDDECQVMLPKHREGGYAHSLIWQILGGSEEAYHKAYPKPEYETLFLLEKGMEYHGVQSPSLGQLIKFKDRKFFTEELVDHQQKFVKIEFNQPNPMIGYVRDRNEKRRHYKCLRD